MNTSRDTATFELSSWLRQAASAALILALWIGGLPGRAAATDPIPGDIGGDFSVGLDGGAMFAVRLPVPPGINGAQPALTLIYNSRVKNGPVGVGWRLNGASSITRCSPIPAVDGHRGTVTYSAGDRYCFGGQRLINVTGDYGAASSIYRTELETWRLVVASAEMCGSGPCSFTVSLRDGSTSTYGASSNSRFLAQGKPDVRVWALTRHTDTNGNSIAYTYTAPAGGQSYLHRIDYSSNSAAGVEAKRSVRLVYDTDRPDPLLDYVGAAAVKTAARLTNVQSFLDSTRVQDYQVVYEQSPATGRSLVTSISMCAADGSCLQPTSFAWQGDDGIKFVGQPVGGATSMPPSSAAVLPVDVNADGRGDLLYVTGDTRNYSVVPLISDGTVFQACDRITNVPVISRARFLPGDVTGDGSSDLLYAYDLSQQLDFQLYTGQPGSCALSAGQTVSTNAPSGAEYLWPMDVNGDGRTDVVGAWRQGGQLQALLFISDGTTLNQEGQATLTVQTSQSFFPMDVNGDGMMDLVQASRAADNSLTLTSYLSTGTTFGEPQSTPAVGPISNLVGLWPMDVNGDAMSDVVQGWTDGNALLHLQPLFADGAGGFVAGEDTTTANGLTGLLAFWPMDVTGDGAIDMVQAFTDQSTVSLVVYRNKNTGFDPGTTVGVGLSPADSKSIWPLDFDGDGKSDLIQGWSNQSQMNFTGFINQGPRPDLIDKITNGLGGLVDITYLPMSDTAVYTRDSGALPATTAEGLNYAFRMTPSQAPFQRVGGGAQSLVSEVTRENDPSINASTYSYRESYSYSAALIGLDGRGSLGFKTITKLNQQTGKHQITTRNQLFPETGTIAALAYECVASVSDDPRCTGEAMRLTDSATDYDARIVAQGATGEKPPVYEVVKKQEVMNIYDYGTPDFSRTKRYTYDDYGNLTRLSDLGLSRQDGTNLSTNDDLYTCRDYRNDVTTTSWALGFPTDQKISKSADCFDFQKFTDGTDFHLEHYSYDDEYNRVSFAIYDNTQSKNLTTTYGYDPFGNRTQETAPGNRVQTFTWDSTYHTFVESETSAPNQRGETATQYFGFDPRYGIRVAETSVNGYTSLRCLDDFGRISTFQSPVPATPAGVKPSPNCLGPYVTGNAGSFRSTTVVTTETRSRRFDSEKRFLMESEVLQDWPVGAAANFLWQRVYYDGKSRRYLQATESDSSPGGILVCTNLDSDDRSTRTSVPTFDGGSQVCTSTTSSGFLWDTQTFDVYGRIIEHTTPSGATGQQPAVTTFSYAPGLKTTMTRAANDGYKYVKVLTHGYFNSMRKIVSVEIPSENATTVYDYDRTGRLKSVVGPATKDNPSGVTNAIAYDSVGRRLWVNNPDQNTTGQAGRKAVAMAYDPATGLLATKTDAKGQVTHFQNDLRARVIRKTFADGTSVHLDYDNSAVNGVGKLTGETGLKADGTTSYQLTYGYDEYGHRTQQSLQLDGTGPLYSSVKQFDPVGRIANSTFPDSSKIVRTYVTGNLWTAAMDGDTYATYTGYTALGLPGNITYGNGATVVMQNSPTGFPTHEQVNDGSGGAVLEQTLEWDNLFNLRAVTDNLKPGGKDYSQTFGYTNLRLTSAEAPGLYGSKRYGYSALGNLTSNTVDTLNYQAHRAMSGTVAGQSFSAMYDDNGNMKQKSVGGTEWVYTYDDRNRLTLVEHDGAAVLEIGVYSDSGRRLVKTKPDGTTVIYPSAGYEITRFPDGDKTEVTKYVKGPYGTIAAVTTGSAGSGAGSSGMPVLGTLYFHSDQVGSTTLTLDAPQGNVSSRVVYLPYGELYEPDFSGPDDFRPKFQGKERDAASALYYFGARYYDPALGRFITPDSRLGSHLFRTDNLNRFAFALNNPTTLVDPTGHSVWDAIAGIAIGVLEITAGVAIDVLSEGALSPLGDTLIGAGSNGVTYSAEHTNNFSWKQYGVQEAEGAVIGLVTAGIGELASPGAEVAADAVADEAATASAQAASEATEDAAGDELSTAGDAIDGQESTEELGSGSELGDEETSCSLSSFVAGSEVWTDRGLVAIEQIEDGGLVITRNAIDRRDRAHAVSQLLGREVATVVELGLVGRNEVRETLLLTAEHPVRTVAGAWKLAGELAAGDRVVAKLTGAATVAQVRLLAAEEMFSVHNFVVDPDHSYFAGELGIWVHNPCQAIGKPGTSPQGSEYDAELQLPSSEYPESADHILDAQEAGHDDVLTIHRAGAKDNRRLSLRGLKTRRGYDRDEYPPAMFREGGEGASVRYIDPSDNRASGSSFGRLLRRFPDGTRILFRILRSIK